MSKIVKAPKIPPAPTSPEKADALIENARAMYARLASGIHENALRGLFLGWLFIQIRDEVGHGNFLRVAKERLPEIPVRTRSELIKLFKEFQEETGVALPAGASVPDAQLALQLGRDAAEAEVVNAAIKFVGSKSLHALMVEYEVREKPKLGGKRVTKKPAPATITDAEQLALQTREELGSWIERGRQLLLRENVCQHLPAEQIRAFADSLNALRTDWRSKLGDLLKQAEDKANVTP